MPSAEEIRKAVPQEEVRPLVKEEEPVPAREKIRHTPSARELLGKATKNGEEPKVEEDKDAGVTLLDYSDLL